ncbi:MAG: DUF3108 domain-containing protein, partial [bacterium]
RLKKLKIGDTFMLQNIDNNNLAKIQVKALRKETVRVKAGRFNCIVVEPQMQGIGLFKKKGRLLVWLSNDKYKIPVMFKSKILIGSINGRLENYKLGNRFR